MSASIGELVNATKALETANDLLTNSIEDQPSHTELHKALRDSCIQRFEFCVELAWKVSMKVLGLQSRAPNPAIREMAQNGLIDDTEVWFRFIQARNKTSHTYEEEIAKAVYGEVVVILPELEKLIGRLRKIE